MSDMNKGVVGSPPTVIERSSASLSYAELEKLAASIAASGLFGIKTRDQAIALMMIAHAEGRHPALAARDYDIIQGRPAKKAEAMLRDFLSSGGTIDWHEMSDTAASATFSHPQIKSALKIHWDIPRAAKAGLATKEMWHRYPRQMLRSRVISEGIRTLWPFATSGMYVPEEIADMSGTIREVADDNSQAKDDRQQISGRTEDESPDDFRRQWLGRLRSAMDRLLTTAEYQAAVAGARVQRALAEFTGDDRDELLAIIAETGERIDQAEDRERAPVARAATDNADTGETGAEDTGSTGTEIRWPEVGA
jgi:hypothetical protein